VNLIPVTVFVVGLGILLLGVLPRAVTPVLYTVLGVRFLVQILGSVPHMPGWLLNLSAFRHVAPVPATPFNLGSTVVFLTAGALAIAGGMSRFSRRDLLGD
jgi:ABC-2 type transport system permease protein